MMSKSFKNLSLAGSILVLATAGCASSNARVADLTRPARAEKLDAYQVFVGSWDWQADTVGPDGAQDHWTGTAKWEWTLDNRCLRGTMTAKSSDASYDATGMWSWHPTRKRYIWWMFNNWGYPQEGSARYDESTKRWIMSYTSVGLDGTTSYGRHEISVEDENTLEWHMQEWADALHLITKIEMTGTYKRRS